MIIDRKSSHLTIAEYCAAHDIRPDQYRYRAKAVRTYALDLIPDEFRLKRRHSRQAAADDSIQLPVRPSSATIPSSRVVESKARRQYLEARAALSSSSTMLLSRYRKEHRKNSWRMSVRHWLMFNNADVSQFDHVYIVVGLSSAFYYPYLLLPSITMPSNGSKR